MKLSKVTFSLLLCFPLNGLAETELNDRMKVDLATDGVLTVYNGYLSNYLLRGMDPDTYETGSFVLLERNTKAVSFDLVDIEWDGFRPAVDVKSPEFNYVETSIDLADYSYPSSVSSWEASDLVIRGSSLVGLVTNFPDSTEEQIDALALFLLNTLTLANTTASVATDMDKVFDTKLLANLGSFAKKITGYKSSLKKVNTLLSFFSLFLEQLNDFDKALQNAGVTLVDGEAKKLISTAYSYYTLLEELLDQLDIDITVEDDPGIRKGTIAKQYQTFVDDSVDGSVDAILGKITDDYAAAMAAASNDSEMLAIVEKYVIGPFSATLNAYLNVLENELKELKKQNASSSLIEAKKDEVFFFRNGYAIAQLAKFLFATEDFTTLVNESPEEIVPVLFSIAYAVASEAISIDNIEVVAKKLRQKVTGTDGRSAAFGNIRKKADNANAYMKAFELGKGIGNTFIPLLWDLALAPSYLQTSIIDGKVSSYGAQQTQITVYKNGEYFTSFDNTSTSLQHYIVADEGDEITLYADVTRPMLFDETRSPWELNKFYSPKTVYDILLTSPSSYSNMAFCVRRAVVLDFSVQKFTGEDYNPSEQSCGEGTLRGLGYYEDINDTQIAYKKSNLPDMYRLQEKAEDLSDYLISLDYTVTDDDSQVLLAQFDSLNSSHIVHNIQVVPSTSEVTIEVTPTADDSITVNLSSSDSGIGDYDYAVEIIWDWGDGNQTTTSAYDSTYYHYAQDGIYEVSVTLVRSSGQTSTSTTLVTIGDPTPPTDLVVAEGNGELTVTWKEATLADSYNIYIATESFADLDFIDNYTSLANAQMVSGITTNNYTFTGLINKNTYHVVVTSVLSDEESDISDEVSGTPQEVEVSSATRPLNDTGITTCSDGDTSSLDCPVTDYEGQDGEYGRDVTDNDDSDGRAGFSFTKLDANGNALSADATEWSCVQDNVTGLIWEVKADDGGLRDTGWTYTWYNSDDTKNGGDAGTENGGSCYDSSNCDSEKFVAAVNSTSLCGYGDWRMPSREELLSLVDYSVSYNSAEPMIDSDYFPNTQRNFYYSALPFAGADTHAWYVSFMLGYNSYWYKYLGYYVRLVRSEQ